MTTAAAPPAPLTAAQVSARIEAAVSQTFRDCALENPHDPATLSMSGLGACARRGAYQIARYAPTNPGAPEKRAADLGTAIHAWLLPRLATTLGGRWTSIERDVVLTTAHGRIPGTFDLDTLALAQSEDADAGSTLVDVKSVNRGRFDRVMATGEIFPEHFTQNLGYAVAKTQQGRPVQWAAWLYLCRDTGRTRTLTLEVTDELTALLHARVALLYSYALHPEFAPREERGPGLSVVCDGCVFLTRCYGPTAVPGQSGAQSSLAASDPDVVDGARRFTEAREARLQWERIEKFWALVLADSAGIYTDGEHSAAIGYHRGASRPDQAAMRQLLEQHGIPVPYTRNRPTMTVTLNAAAPPTEENPAP